MIPDPADELLARFVADLRNAGRSMAPEPDRALRELFAGTARITTQPAAALPTPARRIPVYKRLLTTMPSKIAAGAFGALLAGSVSAGALTGGIALTSSEDDAAVDVTFAEAEEQDSEETEDVAGDTADPVDNDDVVEEVADDESENAEGQGSLAEVAVPVSVSEAAHIHDFDEACGNHGAYVSHFARFGEEPECATSARAAAATDAAGADEAVESTESTSDDGSNVRGDRPKKPSTKPSAKGSGKGGRPKRS